MNIGEKIRKFRLDKKMTQRQLAELTGLSEITIRKYESGERNPKLDAIKKIAFTLNIAISDLLEGNFNLYTEEIKNDFSTDTPTTLSSNQNSIKDADEFPPEIRAAARGMMTLSSEDKKTALDMIDFLSKKGKEAKKD